MKEQLDELEIIDILVRTIGQPARSISRIGDDVAYMPSLGKMLVAKSDMLVGRTDVPKQMKLWQAARKSIVSCVSDFAAKGVRPKLALISLGLPRGLSRKNVQELGRGFKAAKHEYSLEVIGGDTNETTDLVIDCAMIGFGDKVVERRGARPGDVVVVSGYFGYAAAGLRILKEGLRANRAFRRRATASVLMPAARLELGLSLGEQGLLTSSIDSSDGLALSLHELAEHSKVEIRIDWLPTTTEMADFAGQHGIDLERLVLYGGEEYEIVATVPKGRLEEAREIAGRHDLPLVQIGEVVAGDPAVTILRGRELKPVERRGWVHFRAA